MIGVFAHEMGDGEYGTTIVNDRQSLECSYLYDATGEILSTSRNDDLLRQAGDEFVAKHRNVIEVEVIVHLHG